MTRVAGKVVAITGAARGLGRSHAVRLAEEGADVIVLDVGDDAVRSDLDETARLVEKAGRRVVVKQADVRDRAALGQAVDEAVASLGRLDVVIPNAGINPIGPGRPVSAFADTIDVNLAGTINTVHAALPHLTEGGSIILMGSVAGLMPRYDGTGASGPGGAGYAFSKKMVAEYGDWLAVQLAPSGTRVNVVHPTNVPTKLIENDAYWKTFRPDLEKPTAADVEGIYKAIHGIPIAYLEAADVSHLIVYLASDESRYVTGQQLKIDAGLLGKLAAGYMPGMS
ncbi:mycofactocin-coupled SDR family oxidoreductase [Streptosporangium sp. DT93]|uniref:mycofactocin-coupled SDR family oxidoreductase n=1 Tax=Streptosporangium sp. DT93 TaxID=3393428 RepID=UPI003CE73E14